MRSINSEISQSEVREEVLTAPRSSEGERKRADLIFEQLVSSLSEIDDDVSDTNDSPGKRSGEEEIKYQGLISALQEEIASGSGETVLAPNCEYEINGHRIETDDSGKRYKVDKELLPLTEYTINGFRFQTDGLGRIILFRAKPVFSADGERNLRDQSEAGGEDRQPGDQGGHLVARILGGPSGIENIVPMRGTINQGDYKIMEGKITKALREGSDVTMEGTIEYEGHSARPKSFSVKYSIDGRKTVCYFDNEIGSSDLTEKVKSFLSNEDMTELKERLDDARADNTEVSITSIRVEYGESGSVKCRVYLLEENPGEKSEKSWYEYDGINGERT